MSKIFTIKTSRVTAVPRSGRLRASGVQGVLRTTSAGMMETADPSDWRPFTDEDIMNAAEAAGAGQTTQGQQQQ